METAQVTVKSNSTAKIATGFEKKIRLTHLLSLLAVGVAVVYTIIFYLLHYNFLSLFSISIAIAFAGSHFCNRIGYYNLARISIFLIANIFVFYLASSLGRDSAIRGLYFPLLVAIFILFDLREYYKIGFLILFTLTLLGIGEATNYSLFLLSDLPAAVKSVLNISTFFAAILTTLLCIYYLVTINDNAEQFLEIEKNNNKSIIDNSNDIILLVDMDYNIVTLNKALEKSFNRFFGDRSFVGANLVNLINSTDQVPPQFKAWIHNYDRALKGESFTVSEEGRDQSGETRYMETDFNPVYQNGKITGAAVFVHDISARKRMEENIKRLNVQQTAIIDGANYSILSVGLDGKIISYNKGSERILGYSSPEVIGKLGPQDLLSKKQLVINAKSLSEETGRNVDPGFDIFIALSELEKEENEWAVTTKNGKPIILSSSISKLKNDQDEIFGYLIISSDITAKKHAEEQVKKAADEDQQRVWINTGITEMGQRLRVREDDSERLYNNVLSYVTNYIGAGQASLFMVSDVHYQKKLVQIAGYALEAGRSKMIYSFGESLVGQCAAEVKSIVLNDIPDNYIKINSSLGDANPVTLMVMPLIFEGELSGVIEVASFRQFSSIETEFIEKANSVLAASIDLMTRRKKTEELLRESLELNEKLKTQEEELRVGNEELTEKSNLLQASEEELREQQEELMQINSKMEEKATLLEEQNEAMSIKNAEIENARQALKLKAEELETISRYKSEFLANMSHELRTPLNSILILSKLLADNKENPLPPKQAEFATVIQKSGTDLLNLINDILDLSKIESRKIDLDIEPLNIKDLADSIQSLFRELANDKGINFMVSVSEAMAHGITGDRIRTEQILKNLLSNSFKFTPKGGSIDLKIYYESQKETHINPYLNKSDKNICFEVKDSGIGISSEKQELIFEAFRQADGSTSRKYGGTGLGLSISKELALILGGELRLESIPGKGSSFTLILPVNFDPASAIDNAVGSNVKLETNISNERQLDKNSIKEIIEKSEPAAILRSRSKKLILIIEDDANFANLLKKQSEDKGFESIVASSGDVGWEMVKSLKPDAVLLDIGLPVMDGWTILKKMKADPGLSHIPVHIMTGNDVSNSDMKAGSTEIFKKPVSIDQLNSVFDAIGIEGKDKNIKALVVEDSDIQSLVIKKMLNNNGITCVIAANGKQALEKIASEKPGIIITDFNLPDMDGAELIRLVKSNPETSSINIIIYTAKDLNQKENEEMKRYVDAIIIKSPKSQDRLLDETMLFLRNVEKEKSALKLSQSVKKTFSEEASLKGKKILLVDDDMRNIYSLSKVLEEAEVDVIIANDGKEALAKLKENDDINLVLMDIMMPEMDGYEATEKIRLQEKYKKLPIIALTAKAMKGDREKCLESGASDYISKPVDVNKLMSLLRVWLS